ncbi:MAG TPA: hypothetical protein ENJ95_17250 [Bacteroidetes bacterium]|nr:hypothetical protein [Bacteroidota bacterium]
MNSPVLKNPLTELQMELLELFARKVSNEDLKQLRLLFSNYFAQKAMSEMEKVWEERGHTEETEKEWLKEHMRTPYKR